MYHLTRQRILRRAYDASIRNGINKPQQQSTSTCGLSSNSSSSSRLFHSSPRQNSEAAPQQEQQQQQKEQEESVVPIVWTTHRLSQEQIAKVDGIFHKVLWLDLFETSTLTALINQRLGITMNPKQRRALEKHMDNDALGIKAGGGDGGEKEVVEEDAGPKLVDLKLAGFDEKAKIKVIKEVRAIAGLGLKEAKELVESAPKVIQKGITVEQAEEMKKKLEEIGAKIELV